MFQNWRAHVHSTSPMEKCSRQQGPAVSRRIFSRGQTKSLTYYCFCAPLTCCVTSRRGAIKIRNDVTNSAGCSNCFRLCDDAVDPPSHVSRYARSLRPDRKGLMKKRKFMKSSPRKMERRLHWKKTSLLAAQLAANSPAEVAAKSNC